MISEWTDELHTPTVSAMGIPPHTVVAGCSIGFRRVIEALVAAKAPIVAHNCSL